MSTKYDQYRHAQREAELTGRIADLAEQLHELIVESEWYGTTVASPELGIPEVDVNRVVYLLAEKMRGYSAEFAAAALTYATT